MLTTPTRFLGVINYSDQSNLLKILNYLKDAGILKDNLDRVIKCPFANNLAFSLGLLTEAKNLNQTSFTNLMTKFENQHQREDYLNTLSILENAKLLSPDNLLKVIECPRIHALEDSLDALSKSNILNNDRANTLMQDFSNEVNPFLADITGELLVSLNASGILTEDRFTLALEHPRCLLMSINALERFGLLSPQNVNRVFENAEYRGLGISLWHLRRARILSQTNFDALLNPSHRLLLTDGFIIEEFERIHRENLTTDNFLAVRTTTSSYFKGQQFT